MGVAGRGARGWVGVKKVRKKVRNQYQPKKLSYVLIGKAALGTDLGLFQCWIRLGCGQRQSTADTWRNVKRRGKIAEVKQTQAVAKKPKGPL